MCGRVSALSSPPLVQVLKIFTISIISKHLANLCMQPRKGHTIIGLLIGVHQELAPPGEPIAGVAPRSPFKRRGMCASVYEDHASKRSLGSLWI